MIDKALRSPRRSVEFGQHIVNGLVADDARLVAMRRAGRDMDHVARPGLDRMIIETISDPAGQNEDGMSGLAPRGLGSAWWIGSSFLVAQSDAESGHRLPNLQSVAGGAQRMVGCG